MDLKRLLKNHLCDQYCTDIHEGSKLMCDYCNASLLNGPLFLQTAQPYNQNKEPQLWMCPQLISL